MGRLLALLKTFLFSLGVLVFGGALTLIGLFIYFGHDLPDYQQLAAYDPPVVTRIYAGDGRLFREYATEKRLFVPINAIPSRVRDAFIAVEDRTFYEHIGLDFWGLVRAFFHNVVVFVTGKGGVMGGSTITQQVAKNFLLHRKKTMIRKIREAILSLRIEKAYTKDKILELYLNEIYFGKGAYGVAAAALQYFGKSLNDLSTAEIAYLASLPKAPNNYHPTRRPKAALARRNWVIARMMEEGLIDTRGAVSAKKTPLEIRTRSHEETVSAGYFAEEVRRFVQKNFGSQSLYQGGLVVHTTLDSKLQKIAEHSLRKGLIAYDRRHGWHGTLKTIDPEGWQEKLQAMTPPPGVPEWDVGVVLALSPENVRVGLKDGRMGNIPFDTMTWARRHHRNEKGAPYLGPELHHPKDILAVGEVILVSKHKEPEGADLELRLEQIPHVNGALVALNPYTGRVLALVGGFSYDHSEFNRATQARRQSGSAFKPFTYVAALENGKTPATLLHDIPFVLNAGPSGYWAPQNIEKRFFGVNTLRHAVEKSFNASLVRLAHEIGMERVADVANRFGIYKQLPPYLSSVLGSEETTLMQLTAAYGMLVNGGKDITPYLIDRIQDRHGQTVYKADKRRVDLGTPIITWSDQEPPLLPEHQTQATDPITAYQMVSILEGAAIRGTARRAAPKGHIVGAKTGTSNDYKDTWTLGFARDLVVGVFVGFDTPKSLGRFNTGSSVAGPIFKEFMEKALKGEPKRPFRVPSNAKFVKINRKTGERAGVKDKNTLFEIFKPGESENDPGSYEREQAQQQGLQNDISTGIY